MLKYWIFILLFPFFVGAQSYPSKPLNYVTDETGLLSSEQQRVLNAKLHLFEDSTSNQIFVYISNSLNGQEIATLSQEIFHQWQIGQKNKNNGVLIAIFLNEHKFRIHTGYGLEGVLPDLLTKKIQDEYMRPHFKQSNYYEGINAGIDKLIYYSKHQYSPEDSSYIPDYSWGIGEWLFFYGPNAALFFFILFGLKRNMRVERTQRRKIWQAIIGVLFALIPCIGTILLFFQAGLLFGKRGSRTFSSDGNYSDSYWSSSSDSSWSSSDSGSSFDGGGGGDSGGGGSSSDW